MIRIIYRWTVAEGDEEQFIRDWQRGTHLIQDHCAGAHGSILVRERKDRRIFHGIARWESGKAWLAAQPVMAGLKLPGRIPESADFYDELAVIDPINETTKKV